MSALFHEVYSHGRPAIRARAAAVVRTLGLARSEQEDIEQELWLDQWIRLQRFDSNRGSLRAFSARIARNKANSIVENNLAQRRDVRQCRTSLNDLLPNDGGQSIERAETISEGSYLARSGRAHRSDRLDLQVDLDRVRAKLPPELAGLMGRLGRANASEIAGREGYSRATFYRRLHRLRTALAHHGLDRYLQTQRPVCQ